MGQGRGTTEVDLQLARFGGRNPLAPLDGHDALDPA